MKRNLATVTNETLTQPEFMTGEQYVEQFKDEFAGDFIIRIPDTGISTFKAPKQNNSGKGGVLTKAKFLIASIFSDTLPDGMSFENGQHAGLPLQFSMSLYAGVPLSLAPVDAMRSALQAIVDNAESTDKAVAAAKAELANLDKVIASKAEAQAAKDAQETAKATSKPAEVKATKAA